MNDAISYDSTTWVISFYTSEIFFWLHLPLYQIDVNDTSSYARRHILVAFLRRCITIAIIALVFVSIYNIKPYATISEAATSAYISQTVLGLYHSPYKIAMGVLFAISSLLWIGAGVDMQVHVATNQPPLPKLLFFFAHLSIINFVFDIVDHRVAGNFYVRIYLVLSNLVVGSMLTVLLVVQRPLILGWGCYPDGTLVKDLKYGLCFAYDGDSERVLGPACAEDGNVCGEEEIRWKTLYGNG
jgi:hypothetical protein